MALNFLFTYQINFFTLLLTSENLSPAETLAKVVSVVLCAIKKKKLHREE